MAKSKLIKNFINSNMDIDTALQNLLVILNDFDNESLTNWARKELTGYEHNDELPNYRKLTGRFIASYFVGYVHYSNVQFGIDHLGEDLVKLIKTVNFYSSISSLDLAINSGNGLSKPIQPEHFGLIQSNSNANITSAQVNVDVTALKGVTSTVRTKILETLLLLEKEFGNLDDLDIDISTKTTEEVNAIIQNIQVTLYDNSITIGDNNKIKGTNILTNK
ncbi:hypothetical protein JW813_05290 [Clostridium botulinum]|uniref:AbiTii domain-containing protein n=1 Tax=Clostridium botulinum TaxID=1491 RepID=UPI0022453D67|nr:hypothetical protein [Clostridium botulinum]UZP04423.1 hypothetical protein JW813_05290 [Clostridium botulinum]UZP07835.1 hypothetical protein JYA71_05565 [Clostridium botulinum]UZP11162.1 hypothetical protein JYA74_05285 [Clostridium botulinum]